MGNERGKYFSSRYKIQTCSSLGENAVVDDEILFTTVIFFFWLDLWIQFFQLNKPVMHINWL